LLTSAQATGGPLLAILDAREQLQLDRGTHRLAIARRRAASDPHPRAEVLIQRLSHEQLRLEIEILHLRAERSPRDANLRLALARRLKQSGNFSGAIERLNETLMIEPGNPAAL